MPGWSRMSLSSCRKPTCKGIGTCSWRPPSSLARQLTGQRLALHRFGAPGLQPEASTRPPWVSAAAGPGQCGSTAPRRRASAQRVHHGATGNLCCLPGGCGLYTRPALETAGRTECWPAPRQRHQPPTEDRQPLWPRWPCAAIKLQERLLCTAGAPRGNATESRHPACGPDAA